MTFSRSLAELIVQKYAPDCVLKEFNYRRNGKILRPGEISSSGLYGIIGTRKNILLRVQLTKEIAEIFTEDPSRHIEEIFLESS